MPVILCQLTYIANTLLEHALLFAILPAATLAAWLIPASALQPSLANQVNQQANQAIAPATSDDTEPSATGRPYKYEKFTNIFYEKNEKYTLLCDIYQPIGDGPFPAVLAIHGGAWRHGSKLQMLRHAWKLAAAGYVVVAINYRHAPDYKFPAQVHDCKTAVRWMRYKQKKLKIDPDKIAVFGYSAGGHLAAMLGTTNPNDDLEGQVPELLKPYSSRVACVVAGGAPCDFSWIKSNAIKDFMGQGPEENPQLYRQAAPITYVTPDDAPCIFFHGTEDTVVPPSAAKKMYEQLKLAGVTTAFHDVENKGHIATFSDTSWLDTAIKFMDQQMECYQDE